jgi:hypothetical protein
MSTTIARKQRNTVTPREENRKARQERRREIVERWHSRQACRIFADVFTGGHTARAVANTLVHLNKWASVDELFAEVGLADNANSLRVFLAILANVLRLKEMPYDEYLQTPYWKRRAEETKQRYDGRCALDAKHLADDAHHRTYVRRGWEWKDDLVPLCRACHGHHHARSVPSS